MPLQPTKPKCERERDERDKKTGRKRISIVRSLLQKAGVMTTGAERYF
jgi:hypothetical protein